MGDNSSDTMDTSTGEETETEYFQDVANFDDNLDHSIDSLQGSLTIPLFSLDQSTGLQGSRGFQLSAMHANSQIKDMSAKMEPAQGVLTNALFQNQVIPEQHSHNVITQPLVNKSHLTTFGVVNLPGVSSGGSAFLAQGNFNIMTLPDNARVPQGTGLTGGMSYMFGRDRLNPMVQDSGVNLGERKLDRKSDSDKKTFSQEIGESAGSNGDEKPSRLKSPKGKGRKGGSTSSSSMETTPKPDSTSSTVLTKTEPTEQSSLEQLQFKPSLLDEILTEKKMALMRSPEVMRFLQAQQENLARENAMLSKHGGDS